MSIASSFHLHRHPAALPTPREGSLRSVPPAGSAPPALDQAVEPDEAPTAPTVRIGAASLGPAALYLFIWMLVLLGVEVLVFWGGYSALERLGVLESVSRAVATVLGDPVPASGVLPALEFSALLPWAVLGGAALALLWLIGSLAVVLVHNCICAITGGPRVRVK